MAKIKASKILISSFFIVLLTSLVNAAAQEKPAIVNGHLYESDGRTPIKNAIVRVICNNTELKDKTNENGFYAVEFFTGCKAGSIVTARYKNAIATGIVMDLGFIKNIAYINLRLPKIPPEIGSTRKNHKLEIKSLFLEKDSIKQDDFYFVYVRVKNNGNTHENQVKIRITIPELNIIEQKTINGLDKDDQRLRIFAIKAQKDASKGFYTIKAQVFNEFSGETEGVELNIT